MSEKERIYKHKTAPFSLEIVCRKERKDGSLWMAFRWHYPMCPSGELGRVCHAKIRERKGGSLYFRSFNQRWSLKDFEGLLP